MTIRRRAWPKLAPWTAFHRNSGASLVIQGSQRIGRLVPLVVAATVFEPEPFAQLAVGLALSDLLRGALLALDVSAVRRLINSTQPEDVVAAHVGAKVVLGALGLALIVPCALVLFGPGSAAIAAITGLGAIPAALASLVLVRRQVALELEMTRLAVVLASGIGMIGALVVVAASRSTTAFAVSLAVADVLLLLLLSPGMARSRVPIRKSLRLVADSSGLIAMQLAHIGQFRIGVLILGLVGTPLAVGEYTVATRIAEGLVILAAALTASSYPLMAQAHSRADATSLRREFDRSFKVAVLVGSALVGALILVSPIWLPVIFPRYPGAVVPFAIVGCAIVVFFGTSQTTALLNASSRDRAATVSSVLGAAVTGILTIAFAGIGAGGVAVGRAAGEVTRLVLETAALARSGTRWLRGMAAVWSTAAIALGLAIAVGVARIGWPVLGALVALLIALVFINGMRAIQSEPALGS